MRINTLIITLYIVDTLMDKIFLTLRDEFLALCFALSKVILIKFVPKVT